MSEQDCFICGDTAGNKRNPFIECEYCAYKACRNCCERYIVEQTNPICMDNDCKKIWTRKFMNKSFTGVFLKTKWRESREKVFLDRERSLLPATQAVVEEIRENEKIKDEADELLILIRDMERRYNHLMIEYRNGGGNVAMRTTNNRNFIRACPDESCRGFLSTQWKCGLCERFTCSECYVIKEIDIEHECKEEDKETAKLIKNDTKPCPKCATGIYKVEGCFAQDTSIRMWDGSVKMSQDIVLGDVLVGDDGNRRIVEHLMSGEDEMYEINQNNGITYTVNSKHKLVLKFTGENIVHWRESLNSVVEISIDEYLTLDKWSKKNLFGYKSSCKGELITGIEVVNVGKGTYYGWSVNGNKRFVLDDFTVVRNCDQMWCTQCHTAFSWRTGNIETRIHNPHYYEYMRQSDIGLQPNHNDGHICGNQLDHTVASQIKRNICKSLKIKSRDKYYSEEEKNVEYYTYQWVLNIYRFLQNVIRKCLHLHHVDIPRFQVDDVENNLPLRIRYLQNKYTEKKFASALLKNNKAFEKKRDICNLYQMYEQTITEIVFRFNELCMDFIESDEYKEYVTQELADIFKPRVIKLLDEMDGLQKYVNGCLKEIQETYKCVMKYINILESGDYYQILTSVNPNSSSTVSISSFIFEESEYNIRV